MSPNTLFDNFDLIHRRVDAGFRGFEHERQASQFIRNLSGVFEEEYQRSLEEKRLREETEQKKGQELKAKADFVHHIQKSFAMKLSEVTRGPLSNISNVHQSQRVRLPKPPTLKEGKSQRDQTRAGEAPGGANRQKVQAPRARRDMSLNGIDDSQVNTHYKITRSLDAKDKSQAKKFSFTEFMSKLKEKSIITYLKGRQRRNQSYLDQPLFNTQKYEQTDQPKYEKLRSYLLANFENNGQKVSSTARSGELDYFSIKESIGDRQRDLMCEEAPKTASTNYPSSTSRLKHLVSFRERDKDSHKTSNPFGDKPHKEDPIDNINAHLTLNREIAKTRVRREASNRQFKLDTSSFMQPLTNHIPSPNNQNQMKRSKRNLSSKNHSIRVFKPINLFAAEASCMRLRDSKTSETVSNINHSIAEHHTTSKPIYLPKDIFMKLKVVTSRPRKDGAAEKHKACELSRVIDCSSAERVALMHDSRVGRIR